MNNMKCQECGKTSEYEKFCYDCAHGNGKCARCGDGQFEYYIVCKQCMLNEHGKCEKCDDPNDVSGTCSVGCQA